MVRPIGRPIARRTVTLEDLREEFLAHCEAGPPRCFPLRRPIVLEVPAFWGRWSVVLKIHAVNACIA